MKKIITLLFSLGAFTTSFAQYNHQQIMMTGITVLKANRDDQYANSYDGYRNYTG